uniref:UDP-glucuronosyltransferase n=1 Tax=Ditylenchus dipsaci TaxID=166011 RepID=A0A915DUQ9_9BILA
MQFLGSMADLLVEAGHEVHMLVLNVDPKFANHTGSSKVKKIIRIDRPESRYDVMNQLLDLRNPFIGIRNSLRGFSHFIDLQAGFCEDLVSNKDLMKQLKSENYDVGIAEIYGPCSVAIFHHIGVKTSIGALAIHLVTTVSSPFGIPVFSSYVPNMVWPNINGPNMNFWDRAWNFFIDTHDTFNLRDYGHKLMQPIFDKAFEADFPSLRKITKNVSLVFINANEFFELPHPISNKVQYISGIVKSEANPLNQEIKSILDSSASGVVLLSFAVLLDCFYPLSTYDFIWKLKPGDNESAIFSSTPNVHVVNWFDQKAVLEHPNVKAFMTHCGLNSVNEAALAAVPMIGMPLMGDQIHNAAIMVNKGIGVFVPIESTNNPQVLIEALDKVLNQPKYKENSKLLQKKLKISPFTPEEKFLKWVEFAAEFPNLNELNLPFDELGFSHIIV